jgi:predicted CoA-binding protein
MMQYSPPTDIELVEIFQSTANIAVVGFSSRKTRPGYTVPAYLKSVGYRILPVNPYIEEGLGTPAYPDLLSLPEKVDLALIFRRPEAIPPLVEQAVEIGVRVFWMQLGIVHEEAAEHAISTGVQVVMDRCMLIEHKRLKSMGLDTEPSVSQPEHS